MRRELALLDEDESSGSTDQFRQQHAGSIPPPKSITGPISPVAAETDAQIPLLIHKSPARRQPLRSAPARIHPPRRYARGLTVFLLVTLLVSLEPVGQYRNREAQKQAYQSSWEQTPPSTLLASKIAAALVGQRQQGKSSQTPSMDDADNLVPGVLLDDPAAVHLLSPEHVAVLIKERGFFCSHWSWTEKWSNPDQDGISNNFVQQLTPGVLLDQTTGLTWQHSGSQRKVSYDEAGAYIDNLNKQHFAGWDDWRLPSLEEAMTLVKGSKNKNGLHTSDKFDATQKWIWTANPGRNDHAWVVFFGQGFCDLEPTTSRNTFYVKAVRTARRQLVLQ